MAARFWVGGAGTWDGSATTHWSTSSGGASGASAPTTADDATFDANSGLAAGVIITVNLTATANNVTITGPAAKTCIFSFTGSPTFVGTVSVGGGSSQGVNRLYWQANAEGTQRTVTAAAYVITGDVDFSADLNLVYSGGASWTNAGPSFVGVPDSGTGAAFTNRTTPATQTATGTGSFTWSTHTWSGRVPLPQDAVVINNAFVGAVTVTQDMPRAGKSLSVGSTGNFTFTPSAAWILFGNLTLAPVSGTMTWTSTGATMTLAGRGAQTITTNGITNGAPITINCGGGSYTLQDNLTTLAARQVTHVSGTFVDSGKTVSTGFFISTGIVTRTLTLTGTWNLTGTGTLTVWNVNNVGTGLTLTATGSTLNITSTDSAVTKTFAGGGGTYGTLAHTSTGSAGLTITGSNTFAALNLGDTTARTVTLPASGTQTVTGTGAGALTFAGASGQNISFVSSSPGTATTIIAQPCAYSLTFYTFSADIVFSVLYRKLAVTYVSSNGALSTVAADTVFTFAPSGFPGSLAVADHYADAGSVGTTETDIFSDSIAAGRLATNGDKLIATYAGTCGGAASATKTLRAYFGGTVIFSSGALSFGGNSDWEITVTVIRVSSSVVRCIVALTTTGASGATYSQYTQVTGLTLANAQTMKMTGQSGGVGSADNDVTGKLSTVEYVTAAV